jgi:hypothetical protein
MNNKKKVYILLDRSGSMDPLWSETLSSINEYAGGLTGDTEILLAVFDHYDGKMDYKIIRDSQSQAWKVLSRYEIEPRGGTPLYEAATRMFARIFEDNNLRTTVVVMTDGFENASVKDFTSESVKSLVKKAQEKDWGVVFLGADFDRVKEQGLNFGVGASTTMNIKKGHFNESLRGLCASTVSYNDGLGASSYHFTDKDRVRSGEKV